MLADTQLRNLKPTDKAFKVVDSDGPYVAAPQKCQRANSRLDIGAEQVGLPPHPGGAAGNKNLDEIKSTALAELLANA